MRHPSDIRAMPPDTGLVADPNEDPYTPMQPEGEGPGPGSMQDIPYIEPPWGRDEDMPEGEPGEWPEDEQELQRGGMVRPNRRMRRRRRRLMRRPARPHRLMRRPVRRPRRMRRPPPGMRRPPPGMRRRIGYQEGGEVDEFTDGGSPPGLPEYAAPPEPPTEPRPQEVFNEWDTIPPKQDYIREGDEEIERGGPSGPPMLQPVGDVQPLPVYPHPMAGRPTLNETMTGSRQGLPLVSPNGAWGSQERLNQMFGPRQPGFYPRGYKRGGPVKGDDENLMLRRMVKAPRRGYLKPTGYAAGGEVGYGVSGPVMMSVALDSREKSGDHWAEDAIPLESRPEGAPEVPTEGGEGYQEGGEVEYEEEDNEGEPEPEEEAPPVDLEDDEEEQEREREIEGRPPPEEMDEEEFPPPTRDYTPSPRPEEGEPDEEGGGGPGQAPPGPGEEEEGGGPPPTGYNAPPGDQADRDPQALRAQEQAAQEGTGYQPTLADRIRDDPGQVLKDVMDWTQKQFGIGAQAATPPKPGAPAETEPAAAGKPPGIGAPPATPVALPPPPVAGEQTGAEAERPPTGGLAAVGAPTAIPTPAQAPTAPAQQPDQRAAPAAQPQASQALQDYLQGKRSFTPEQMTQLLDKATQENPNLDQGGAIRKAFGDLVGKGDMDGASRFVQSLRPSYDNLRAAMIAATSKGDFAGALQIAERMNNLIPNGKAVQFTATEDGRIMATVRPDGGGPAQQYSVTPQQFARYAAGAGSVFDVTAAAGIDKALGATPVNPRELSPQAMTAATALGTQAAGQFAPGAGAGAGAGRPAVGDTARPSVAEIRQPGQARTGYQQPVTPAPAEAAPGTPLPQARPAEANAPPQTGYQGGQRTVDQQRQGTEQPRMREGPGPGGGAGDRRQWQNQRPGDTISGRSNAAASGRYDVERPNAAARQWKYGRDVRDPDGWPSGIPRGGQFSPNGRSYDIGGHTYDVDRRGFPLAQQGQPGWHGPQEGQPRWNGTPGENRPDTLNQPLYQGGGFRYTPEYQRNAEYARQDEQQRRADEITTRREQLPGGAEKITVGGGERDTIGGGARTDQRQLPTTDGQRRGPVVRDLADPTGREQLQPRQDQQPQGQQGQQGQRQDPNLKPDGSLRRYGEPYFGTIEQKRQQYQSDMKEYDLKRRAQEAYPNDPAREMREYNRLKAQEAMQTRHQERQILDRDKLAETKRMHDDLNNARILQALGPLVRQREKQAFDELQGRVKDWRANNPDPKATYPYTARDNQLLERITRTAVENDIYEQLRPQLKTPNQNAPLAQPVAPAAPRNAPGGGGGNSGAQNRDIDLKTYRGDKEPYPADPGMVWERSKKTQEWRQVPE